MQVRLRRYVQLAKEFKNPLGILAGTIAYLLLSLFHFKAVALVVVIAAIGLGSYTLFRDIFVSVLKRQFALDYIAILAIVTALITKEYFVAAVLALMISSGKTLDEYGVSQAKKSLTKLVERIPDSVILWKKGRSGRKEKIKNVRVGQEILVRKGEVIALDGMLVSESGQTDESSLTGEPYLIDKLKGDQIRSGTINIGEPIVIRVTKAEKDSTYKKIVAMVKEAQEEKSPLVRLADKYSIAFTIITLAIAAFAFFHSGQNLNHVLAVLAIATPCPLLIATPIALLGGVNASAKRRIIVKKLSSLEALSRISTIIFDKTGTITLGKPQLTGLKIAAKRYKAKDVLAIAEAIERNSLHPLAKAIVAYARERNVPVLHAVDIKEKIGSGISGVVRGKRYSLSKIPETSRMTIGLMEGKRAIAMFIFEDQIKEESKEIITHLEKLGLELFIFTGDRREVAEEVAMQLGGNVVVKAECTPEDKKKGIEELRKQGKVVAMVGDGINDAPALAFADVGLVFSNEEQTAASEAADIVFLGGDFSLVMESFNIAKRTIGIAKQSIIGGIGLSIIGMLLASVGIIPPIVGAGIQEAIDVVVIINALRASR